MSENIHKSHNVSKLMYHFVFPTKYRRVVVDDEVEEVIKETCIEISKRYDLYFLEIGTDKDHVHFLIQSTPSYSPMQIVKIVKSITAREVFTRCPEVKKKLWGGNFWSSGYYVATVSEHGNEEVIANYVKNQGNEYKKLFRNIGLDGQMSLFDYMLSSVILYDAVFVRLFGDDFTGKYCAGHSNRRYFRGLKEPRTCLYMALNHYPSWVSSTALRTVSASMILLP